MNRASARFAMVTLLVGGALTFAPAAQADEAIDTVFLANGGRVRGAVMVDDAKLVSVRLADGKTKEIARSEVMRIEYAATTTEAAPPATKSRPKAEPDEEEAAPAPPRKQRRSYEPLDDADSAPEQRADDEAARQRRLTGARRMVAAGGTLTAIGWAGVLGGLVAVGFGAANGDSGPFLGGALVAGFSLPLGITGSVLLSVGVRQRRKASSAAFLMDSASEWEALAGLGGSAPPLSLPHFTVSF